MLRFKQSRGPSDYHIFPNTCMSASTHINITHTYYVIFVPKLLVELRIDSNKLCNVYMFQILFQSNIADHR